MRIGLSLLLGIAVSFVMPEGATATAPNNPHSQLFTSVAHAEADSMVNREVALSKRLSATQIASAVENHIVDIPSMLPVVSWPTQRWLFQEK